MLEGRLPKLGLETCGVRGTLATVEQKILFTAGARGQFPSAGLIQLVTHTIRRQAFRRQEERQVDEDRRRTFWRPCWQWQGSSRMMRQVRRRPAWRWVPRRPHLRGRPERGDTRCWLAHLVILVPAVCPSGALHGAVSARTDTCVAWALGIRFWTRVNDRLDQHRQAEWTETPAGSCSEGRGSHPNQTGSGQHGRASLCCARESWGAPGPALALFLTVVCTQMVNPRVSKKHHSQGINPLLTPPRLCPPIFRRSHSSRPPFPLGRRRRGRLRWKGGLSWTAGSASGWPSATLGRLLARPSYSIDRRVRVRNDAVGRASGRAGRQAALDAWRSCRRAAGVVGRPTCLPAGPVTCCSRFGPAPLSALSSHTPGWPALHACTRSSVWPSAGRPAGHCSLSIIVACRADFWPPWSST